MRARNRAEPGFRSVPRISDRLDALDVDRGPVRRETARRTDGPGCGSWRGLRWRASERADEADGTSSLAAIALLSTNGAAAAAAAPAVGAGATVIQNVASPVEILLVRRYWCAFITLKDDCMSAMGRGSFYAAADTRPTNSLRHRKDCLNTCPLNRLVGYRASFFFYTKRHLRRKYILK